MKLSVILLSLLILCNNYFNYCEGQVLLPAQLSAAQDFLTEIYGSNTLEPCTTESMDYLTCTPLDDNYLVVTGITIKYKPTGSNQITITTDFSVFASSLISFVYDNEYVEINYDILGNIASFTQLKFLTLFQTILDVPSDVVVPSNLQKIIIINAKHSIGAGLFNVPELDILYPLTGYSLPLSLVSNSRLINLNLPVTSYSSFPNNLGNSLINLNSLNLVLYNGKSNQLEPNLGLPNFGSIVPLKTLSISFNVTGLPITLTYSLPTDMILSLKNLTSIDITGDGFTNSQSEITDLSNLSQGLLFTLEGSCSLVETCSQPPCLLLPVNASILTVGCNYNLNNLNYFNYKYLHVKGNDVVQSLPANFDLNNMEVLDLSTDCSFEGTIPESYCQYKGNLAINNNHLDSPVPTCFTCLGALKSPSQGIISINNAFNNELNSTSKPSTCPTFTFDLPSNGLIAKTDGSSVWTINGKDFGWELISVLSETDSSNIEVIIPNQQIKITVGKGVGNGLSVTGYFTSNPGSFKFNYAYELPVITGYSITNDIFSIQGTGFDYDSENEVTVNGETLFGSNSIDGSILFNGDDNPIDLIKSGGTFKVQVIAGKQLSNVFEFYINTPTPTPSTSDDHPSTASTLNVSILLCFISFLILSIL